MGLLAPQSCFWRIYLSTRVCMRALTHLSMTSQYSLIGELLSHERPNLKRGWSCPWGWHPKLFSNLYMHTFKRESILTYHRHYKYRLYNKNSLDLACSTIKKTRYHEFCNWSEHFKFSASLGYITRNCLKVDWIGRLLDERICMKNVSLGSFIFVPALQCSYIILTALPYYPPP